jgi:hypothetical protein
MPIPQLKSITESLGGSVATMGGWGLMGALSLHSYHQRVKGGEYFASAAVKEGASFAMGALLSGPAAFAIYAVAPAVGFGTTALIGAVNRQTTMNRQMRTPFSHRFEHTEITARAQVAGLQAIGASVAHQYMGSEAAMMARRYGR